MVYCTDKAKAIVDVYKNGKVIESHEFNTVPIDVSVEFTKEQLLKFAANISLKNVTVAQNADGSWSGTGKGMLDNCSLDGTTFTTSSGNQLIVVSNTGDRPRCGGSSIAELVKTWTLKVTHNSNNLLTKSYPHQITFKVRCDEDCPEGHLKCECPGYPGYCCIPCSEIRNGIAAATSAIRSINHG